MLPWTLDDRFQCLSSPWMASYSYRLHRVIFLYAVPESLDSFTASVVGRYQLCSKRDPLFYGFGLLMTDVNNIFMRPYESQYSDYAPIVDRLCIHRGSPIRSRTFHPGTHSPCFKTSNLSCIDPIRSSFLAMFSTYISAILNLRCIFFLNSFTFTFRVVPGMLRTETSSLLSAYSSPHIVSTLVWPEICLISIDYSF